MSGNKARRTALAVGRHRTSGLQTLGVGGVITPVGAILGQGDASGLNISTSGSAGNQRVYDGQGRTIGRLVIAADYVTVQNYYIRPAIQYGANIEGTGLILQNNDIANIQVVVVGDDLNAITAFGNNIWILFNNAVNFVTGNPGTSHTDFIQTWVSTSHPTASSHWAIVGNYATGPANPTRDSNIASIHQCVMAEDAGQGGNTGGNSGQTDWFIAENTWGDSWGQTIKLDGVDNVDITRNNFIGSSDNCCEFTTGSNQRFWSDNIIGSSYGQIGVTVTSGSGPATPTYGTGP